MPLADFVADRVLWALSGRGIASIFVHVEHLWFWNLILELLEVIIQHLLAVDLISGEFNRIIVRWLLVLVVQLLWVGIKLLLILLVWIHCFTLVQILIIVLLIWL